MYYRIGLDIGITSVGWAVIENDSDGKPIRIVDLGSRIFDAAEVPKTGAPLAEHRREARSSRRRNRRKVYRILRTKKLLEKFNILTNEEIQKLYDNQNDNIYELRVAALDRELKPSELAKVLINLVKKRGYRSVSKSEEKAQSENGKALSAISDNKKLMEQKSYRSVAEMYLTDEKFKLSLSNGEKICDSNGVPILKIRNTVDDYKTTVERSLILEEIQKILETQKKFNNKINDEFIQEYIKIFSSQRNFDEGPGKPSKYSGNLIENMVGNCTFEQNEKRAAKATFTFEKFKLLQDFNSIKLQKINLISSANGNIYNKSSESRALNESEKIKLLEKFRKTKEMKFSSIRKLLEIPYDYVFNYIDYDFGKKEFSINEIIDEAEKKSKKTLKEFISFHEMRSALDKYEKNYIYNFTDDDLDYIATVLSLYKSDENRIKELKKLNLNDEVIKLLLPISFSKFSHLSLVAMKNIIPYLEEGLTYDKAVNNVYPDFRGNINTQKKSKLSLKDIEEITNPVVRRGVSQAIKVINAIVCKYGSPDLINVELAREISKNYKERKIIEKKMEDNMLVNNDAIKEIHEYKDNVTGKDIVKYKLWQEQDGKCPYSGKVIRIEELFSDGVDIDHIIPYSKCFDDSYNNKVLAKSSENKMKTNRVPLEYISESGRSVDEYIVRVQNMYSTNKAKLRNLLKEHFTEEDEEKWKERNLKDTQYITRVILNLIRKNLEFRKCDNISENKRAMAVNGRITAQIRKRYGLVKLRDGDKHHAMDAAVIAITTESMIQKITNYEKNNEIRYLNNECTKEEYYQKFPVPYEKFVEELKARLMDSDEEVERALKLLDIMEYKLNGYPKAIFVSRMPVRKVRGCAHKDTINGISKSGKIVKRVDLTNLKLDKNGEILGYYNKSDDKLLYNALRKKLIENNNDAQKAFSEPFFKPKSDGTRGPLVKKVKIEEKSTNNVYLRGVKGVAANDSIVRVDVFYVPNDGYYFIPIYVADTIKGELPNKACVAYKVIEDWKVMDDKNFIFSIYPKDLIYIKSKKDMRLVSTKGNINQEVYTNEVLGYFNGCDISTGGFSLSVHDRSYDNVRVGIKRLEELKKYQVDVLGKYTEVKLPEKRMEFKFKKSERR